MMPMIEKVTTALGEVERFKGKHTSPVLAQLPGYAYPNPRPGCATCPAADWWITVKHLRCWCTERGFVSWVSNEDPVMVCDPREELILEEEKAARADKGGNA